VKIRQTSIAWDTDKRYRYANPPGFDQDAARAFQGTVRPLHWRKPVYELDPQNASNNGLQNEALMVDSSSPMSFLHVSSFHFLCQEVILSVILFVIYLRFLHCLSNSLLRWLITVLFFFFFFYPILSCSCYTMASRPSSYFSPVHVLHCILLILIHCIHFFFISGWSWRFGWDQRHSPTSKNSMASLKDYQTRLEHLEMGLKMEHGTMSHLELFFICEKLFNSSAMFLHRI
jgi:hypothetical protein